MATIETALTLREALNRLYFRMRDAYRVVLAAKPGDPEADRKILVHIEGMEELLSKIDFSFVRKVLNDANVDAQSHELLEKLHLLMKDMEQGKRKTTHKQHLLYRKAKEIKKKLGRRARSAKKQKDKHIKKVTKDVKKKEGTIRTLQKDVTSKKQQLKKVRKK